MTISESLRWGYKKLQKKSTSAALDAEVLLAFILNKDKEFLYTFPERGLSKQQQQKFKKFILQRGNGMPIAYLTGHKEFYGLDFIVSKDVLIPRPETELMIDEVLKQTADSKKNIILIDVGVGSGCIPIAIAKNIFHKQYKIFATDISSKTLSLAKRNAQKYKIKINLIKANLLQPFLKKPLIPPTTEIIITANLPYLTTAQMKERTIKFEPRVALYGGHYGLDLYRELLKQIKILQPSQAVIFLEIDPAQKQKIKTLIKKILPLAQMEIKKDLAHKDRLVIIKI